MSNKSWIKLTWKIEQRVAYCEASRSKPYPFSSERQNSKKYAEFDSCGRKTLGRIK